jgi:hypothetical protein
MDLAFHFAQINAYHGRPRISISLNNRLLYSGEVKQLISLKASDTYSGNCSLRIEFINKNSEDTKVVDGNIVCDKNFTLEKVIIDGCNLEELIWKSAYHCNNETINSCLFFGPAGYWELNFTYPILYWILSNRNEDGWYNDYCSYLKAWNKVKHLTSLS